MLFFVLRAADAKPVSSAKLKLRPFRFCYGSEIETHIDVRRRGLCLLHCRDSKQMVSIKKMTKPKTKFYIIVGDTSKWAKTGPNPLSREDPVIDFKSIYVS
jgi:hypothetical protein